MHRNLKDQLAADPWFVSGTCLLLIMALAAAAAPWLAPFDPRDISFDSLSPPSSRHWLGVNDGGIDIASELLYGIRNTALFGLLTGSSALLIGVLAGLAAAWFGRTTDILLMRLADVLLAIPSIMILILVAAAFRPAPAVMAIILAAFSWATIAKVIRAQALVVKSSLHVQAARQMGASGSYIIRRHLLPELFPLYLIGFASQARMAMFTEAGLSFLGLFEPTRPSLGMMINQALNFYYLPVWWNWLIPPIACLSLLIMGITFVAVSMEKLFDPRLREAL